MGIGEANHRLSVRSGVPQQLRPTHAAADIANLAELVGMVAHEHRCAIAAEAPEDERRADLLPNASEHGLEIRIGTIETELRDRRPEIKRIVTTVERRYLSPCHFRPIVEYPHDN